MKIQNESYMTEYILGIGSNEQPEEQIRRARQTLCARFPDIWFSPVRRTEPVGFQHNSHCFLNCLAVVHTDLDTAQLKVFLKQTESEAGRTPEDKQREVVRLDLDILAAGRNILKAEELQRPYYQELLQEYDCHKAAARKPQTAME